MNEATRETAPFHIWKHEMTVEAIGRGVSADFLESPEIASRIVCAYAEGEPVWMVVDEMVFRAKRGAVEARADQEATALRRRLAGGRRL